MAKFFKSIISWLAFLGLIISSELTYIYMNANFGLATNKSFCNINDVLDCDAVARTSYSHFLGVPLSVWGIIFYLVILIFNYLRLVPKDADKKFSNTQSYIYSLSFVAVGISLALSSITSFGIKKVCILCVVNYLINILMFCFSKGKISFTSHIKNTLKDLYFALTNPMLFLLIAILFSTGLGSLYYVNANEVFVKDKTIQIPKTETINMTVFNGNILGDPDAKLKIEEYTDFECPYCAMANADFYKLVKELKNVKIVHRDFPLKKECNPALSGEGPHKYSCIAALYSMAAVKQGNSAYFDYLLFLNQENLQEKNIIKIARQLKLDIGQLRRDANAPETLNELKENTKNAALMGIHATPTFFVGLKKYEGMMKYEEMKKLMISFGATPR
jgi:protein-disulfide isomerase/uncharacterized membrane protein